MDFKIVMEKHSSVARAAYIMAAFSSRAAVLCLPGRLIFQAVSEPYIDSMEVEFRENAFKEYYCEEPATFAIDTGDLHNALKDATRDEMITATHHFIDDFHYLLFIYTDRFGRTDRPTTYMHLPLEPIHYKLFMGMGIKMNGHRRVYIDALLFQVFLTDYVANEDIAFVSVVDDKKLILSTASNKCMPLDGEPYAVGDTEFAQFEVPSSKTERDWMLVVSLGHKEALRRAVGPLFEDLIGMQQIVSLFRSRNGNTMMVCPAGGDGIIYFRFLIC